MFGNVEGRRELLAYIAAIGGRATAFDLVALAPHEDVEALGRALCTLATDGWLDTPFGAMEGGDSVGREAWLRRYRPGQVGVQVYEITRSGRAEARAAATHPVGNLA